jgi:hypothetical protein
LIAIGPTNYLENDELLVPLKEKDLKEEKEDTTACRQPRCFSLDLHLRPLYARAML